MEYKSDKLYSEFFKVNVTDGDDIRFLPYATIRRAGHSREVDRDLAARFQLPHFKPPIKLGSHDATAPAGGHITGCYAGDNGLWIKTQWNDRGKAAMDRGDFKYFSPEVIWPGGSIEDVLGEKGNIPGPLVMGLALLHTPAFGEEAALYSIEETQTKEIQSRSKAMTVDTVEVPKKWYDGIVSRFGASPEQPKEPEKLEAIVSPENTEAYQALTTERDEYKAEVEKMKAKAAKAEMFDAIRAEFDTEEFGAAFIELGKADEATEMLAAMPEDPRAWVLTTFKAMSAQIDESELLGERGSAGAGPDIDEDATEADKFNAKVLAHMEKNDTDYLTAFDAVKMDGPKMKARPVAGAKEKA